MRTLKDLTEFVEEEAAREGPAAQAALQAERDRFRLARELAELRKSLGLTQQQLSKRSGVPQSDISKIESGKANATGLTLSKMVNAMGHTLRIEPLATMPVPRRSVRTASKKKGSRTVKRVAVGRELEPAV